MSGGDKQAPAGAADAASTLDAALEERFGRHFEVPAEAASGLPFLSMLATHRVHRLHRQARKRILDWRKEIRKTAAAEGLADVAVQRTARAAA